MKNPSEHLKDLIKIDRGITLPIKGGTGISLEDPIVIENSEEYSCVNVEYELLDYFGKVRGIEWRLLEQKLISHGKKRIDIMKIETKQFTEEGVIIKIEDYYFDISDCF